jgi:hypothetical protein
MDTLLSADVIAPMTIASVSGRRLNLINRRSPYGVADAVAGVQSLSQ